MKNDRAALFFQADEIDHITIRYTDYGEKMNIEKAKKLIHFYVGMYDEVKNAVGEAYSSFAFLGTLSDREIYEALVKIRTVFLSQAFGDGKL